MVPLPSQREERQRYQQMQSMYSRNLVEGEALYSSAVSDHEAQEEQQVYDAPMDEFLSHQKTRSKIGLLVDINNDNNNNNKQQPPEERELTKRAVGPLSE
mmetsp:Transcript_27998/g.65100  ORF Transcript_27998/g.65100 Transcript_27998/m.65100 type:complete len:100 (+) Transcript_27998:69-368(+)